MFNKSRLVLFCILFLGLFLRLYGNNWDQGWHLHPDERFLTMVGVDVKIPPSINQYLNQQTSSFNPVNKGHGFYVYGTFPVLLNKIIATYIDNDTYDLFNLQGRVLSGVADFLIIIIIYKLIELGEKKLKFTTSIKYFGAFFYAIAVLPIQLSHFFTVDTFLNLFCWLSLYFSVKLGVYSRNAKHVTHNVQHQNNFQKNVTRYTLHATRFASLSGLFLGLAIACKVSAIYFAPLIGIVVLWRIIVSLDPSLYKCIPQDDRKGSHSEKSEESSEGTERRKIGLLVLFGLTVFILSCYFALRFGSPYYFETNSIFNPQLSKIFINNINTLKSFENPQALYPPAVQWVSKSYFFVLKNMIFFGVGPFYFLLSCIGVFLLVRKKNIIVIISILWCVLFTIYQSLQFAKTMRYLIFIYPFLAIFAAVGLSYVFFLLKKTSNVIRYTICALCFAMIIVWPLAFMSIYTKDHSRVAASKWIYEHIPQNSSITYEYWDDPLPLMVQNPATRNYKGIQINIFDPDTQDKWKKINNQLAQVDFYVMSSNRGWGSIGDALKIYPQTSIFYKNLFAGKLGFKKISEFTSYPSLRYLGIPIDFPDQWAEEAFTVYDHPQVLIYRNEKTNKID